MQFLFAVDRGNKNVAERFDLLSAPMLRALKYIADRSNAHGKPVSLCGEMASNPLCAMILAALGYRTLSLSPTAVGPVKAALLDLDCGKAATALIPLIDKPAGSVSLRDEAQAFATAEGMTL